MKTDTLHILPQTKFLSPYFDANNIADYQLNITLSENYFHCWVKNYSDSSLLALESYQLPVEAHCHSLTSNLEIIFVEHEFLKSLKWKNVEVAIDNQSFTLLPLALFRKEYTSKYLQLAKGNALEQDEEVRVKAHPDLEILNIYSAERTIFNWFEEVYPLLNIQYQHFTSQLIDFSIRSSKAQTAFLHFGNGAFTFVIVINGALKYCNRFQYKTPEDLVYFVLFVMSELEIEPDEVFIRLYGNIDLNSADYLLLNQYLPKVKIGDTTHEHLLENQIEEHRYIGLC